MKKYTQYQNRVLVSAEIDGEPYVRMEEILDSIVPGAWSDYQQVINADEALKDDLGVIYVPGNYLNGIPSGQYIRVSSVSEWLYSINIRDASEEIKSRFRMFRRDCEKVLRITWAKPVEDPCFRRVDVPYVQPSVCTVADLANYMLHYGLTENTLYSEDVVGVMDFIYHIAGSRECGENGKKLVSMLDYIEELPFSEYIIGRINDVFEVSVPEIDDAKLGEYIDKLNVTISFITSQFFGEQNAAK